MELLYNTLLYVVQTLKHNALWLMLGIGTASVIRVYLDPEKLKHRLTKSSGASIPGSVAFGAFTPFCACGTMAVVVAMMTTVLPWGPIMAFLTSSPLMSPDFFILLSGVVSLRFAIALTVASIGIGLTAGIVTYYIEANTSWLTGQARFTQTEPTFVFAAATAGGGCCTEKPNTDPYKLKELFDTVVNVGLKKVLVYFSVFAAVAYWINQFVPTSLITSLFGSNNLFAVPIAALLGIPLYVSGSSSLPLINTLLAGGASGGVLLAFMITGPGTSLGAIAGIMTIMKKKAVGLYVLYIFIGAVTAGYLYNLINLFIK